MLMQDLKSVLEILTKCDLNNHIVISAFNACVKLVSLEYGKKVHELVQLKMVHPFSPEVQCCTINMYAKCGDIATAESLFRSIKSEAWNIVTVNTMISAYAQYGKVDQAFELFHSMIDLKPNEETFVCLLNACSHAVQPEKAKIVYE